MPNQIVLQVQAGQLPSGFCPATYQEMLNGYSAKQTVTFPSTFGGLIMSASKPTDPTQAWLRLDSLGRMMGLYNYAQGYWLSAHPMQPGMTVWYFNALPDFTTYDGGDSNAAGLYSGPMWQQAKDINNNVISAQFPIAAGTLESGSVLSVGGTGGEETHALTSLEMPPHIHSINFSSNVQSGDSTWCLVNEVDSPPTSTNRSFTKNTNSTGGNADTPPVVQAHNNMPPYAVGYLLQRTSRIYYSVS